MDPDSTKSWHKGTPRIPCQSPARPYSPPTHPPPQEPSRRPSPGHSRERAWRAGRGAGMGAGAVGGGRPRDSRSTAGLPGGERLAAKARVVAAGAEPERRGTGRRGPGTAAPGELPCHGEAGGRAGRAALEHGCFPARPHRQSLPPAHARLPRARYGVPREGTLRKGGGWTDRRDLSRMELAGLRDALGPGPCPPCPQRWEPRLSSGAAPGTTGAPEPGEHFLAPSGHRIRNWRQGWEKVSCSLWNQ